MNARTFGWLVATWVAFGSLFVAAKIGVGLMPPLVLAALRFLIAGVILYLVGVRVHGAQPDPVGRRQWLISIPIAAALAFINGIVMLASTQMDSWIVSVLTCTIPLWCYAASVLFARRPMHASELVGMFAGIAGIVILLAPIHETVHISVGLSVLLLLGAMVWGRVTVFEKSAPIPKRPLVAMALQTLIAGVMLLVWSAVAGEWHVPLSTLTSLPSLAAILYLALIGSVLGYGAYMWLIVNAGPTIANSFGYVSPAIAVLLGWLILHEAVTMRTFVAFALIVVAVTLILAPHPLRLQAPIDHKIHR